MTHRLLEARCYGVIALRGRANEVINTLLILDLFAILLSLFSSFSCSSRSCGSNIGLFTHGEKKSFIDPTVGKFAFERPVFAQMVICVQADAAVFLSVCAPDSPSHSLQLTLTHLTVRWETESSLPSVYFLRELPKEDTPCYASPQIT